MSCNNHTSSSTPGFAPLALLDRFTALLGGDVFFVPRRRNLGRGHTMPQVAPEAQFERSRRTPRWMRRAQKKMPTGDRRTKIETQRMFRSDSWRAIPMRQSPQLAPGCRGGLYSPGTAGQFWQSELMRVEITFVRPHHGGEANAVHPAMPAPALLAAAAKPAAIIASGISRMLMPFSVVVPRGMRLLPRGQSHNSFLHAIISPFFYHANLRLATARLYHFCAIL